MKNLRLALWILVAIAVAVVAYGTLNNGFSPKRTEQAAVKLGGPFELINHKGETITEAVLKDRTHAIFFGFTNCPDICPTTLLETAGWLKSLGDDGDKIDFYFITVDPTHDTPEILNDYIEAFDTRITGITGTQAGIDETVKSYRAYAQRVELDDGDYTMDHSAFVMLFNDKGDFKGTISYGENTATALEKLKRLIGNG